MTTQQPTSAMQRMIPNSLDRKVLTAGAATCSFLLAASFLGGVVYGRNVERREQCYQRGMELARQIGEDETLKRGRIFFYNKSFKEQVREGCNYNPKSFKL